MKHTLALLLLVGAALSARAQLLESREFSGVGDTGVAVHGYLEFWNDSGVGTGSTGTVKLYVENFSVYRLLDNSLTGFENGIITAFGFDVGSGFTWTSAFSQSNPAFAIPTMAVGTDAINFAPEKPFFNSGVNMDIGGDAVSPGPHNGLAGGFSALFTFGFSAANDTFFSDNFNGSYFFSPPDDLDNKDLFFRFQAVSTNGRGTQNSDKVFITWDDGGGGFDNPVPEPSTYGLFGAMALLALVIARRRGR